MHPESPILALCGHLALLFLMAVGDGVIMVMPKVQSDVVIRKHWLSNEQFAAGYAIAQAAPGPNLLFIALVGWVVAGWSGAMATTVSILLPSTRLTLALSKVRPRQAGNAPSRASQQAIAAICIGLLGAPAFVFACASDAACGDDVLT